MEENNIENNVENTESNVENTESNVGNSIGSFEIVSSPEELQASMEREGVQFDEPQQPVEEPIQEQAPESDYVDPEAYTEEEISEEEMERAVLDYMSERLGGEFQSFDDFSQPAVDDRLAAINQFVQDTGRAPEDWFAYQRLNPSEMDDMTAIRVDMAAQHPNLSNEEVNMLVDSKYKLDPDLNSEQEVKLAQLQLKMDAEGARSNIEEIRDTYAAPEAEYGGGVESFVDDQWLDTMAGEVNQIEGLEFDLGNDETFTFGIDDQYRNTLIDRNAQIENFFDPYIREDGSWDHDKLSSHLAVIDNIDKIVQSAYRQGVSQGQRGIVDSAANIGTQQPMTGQSQNAPDPILSQIKNAMGGNRGMTFNI